MKPPEIMGRIPTVIIYQTAVGTCVEPPGITNRAKKKNHYKVPFVVVSSNT